jgi:phthalate 4,5-dioxygenase
LSSELPRADSDPVRIMLLGEQLIAFRDTSGRVGLIQNLCPHRGASLFFGRNEENGLRCVYHGWKFDTTGQCVDMPNEPSESNFKQRIKANAYLCEERGGIVWTYLGSREVPPPLPDFEANQLPEEERVLSATSRDCNWLQALEGDIDTSHLAFLHQGATKPENTKPGTFGYYTVKDRAPRYVAIDTDFGAMYGAYRPAEPGQRYWRIAQFLFPFYTQIPTGILGHQILSRAWVPMDDDHTLFFYMGARTTTANREPNGQVPIGRGIAMRENTTDWFGRFRMVPSAENDYLIDRAAQRGGKSYTGILGTPVQDTAVTESMGALLDRSNEHLGSSDMMIIRVRRRLIEATQAFLADKVVPPGVDDPEVYRVRSGGVFLSEATDWLDGIAHLLPAYRAHPELDLNLERQ